MMKRAILLKPHEEDCRTILGQFYCPGIKTLSQIINEHLIKLPQEGLTDSKGDPKECALCLGRDLRNWNEVQECLDRLNHCDDDKLH